MIKTPAYNRQYSNVPNCCMLLARCDIAAGGAVAATSNAPSGLGTWTLAGTGRYLLTLPDGFVATDTTWPQATVLSATAQDLVPQISILSATTLEIRLNTGATPTAPAAACSIVIHIATSNSTVK